MYAENRVALGSRPTHQPPIVVKPNAESKIVPNPTQPTKPGLSLAGSAGIRPKSSSRHARHSKLVGTVGFEMALTQHFCEVLIA